MRGSFLDDRQLARVWARDLLNRADWAVLDTETTGLGNTAEVIQIAVVAPDGGTLLDTLVRPNAPIPADATAIHGITDVMVERAPPYLDVYPALLEVLRGKLVVCYNAAFDRRLLRQTAVRSHAPELPVAWDCAMEQYSRFIGRRSARGGSYSWQPLPRRAEYRFAKHQAIVDCLATLDVIRTMAGA